MISEVDINVSHSIHQLNIMYSLFPTTWKKLEILRQYFTIITLTCPKFLISHPHVINMYWICTTIRNEQQQEATTQSIPFSAAWQSATRAWCWITGYSDSSSCNSASNVLGTSCSIAFTSWSCRITDHSVTTTLVSCYRSISVIHYSSSDVICDSRHY